MLRIIKYDGETIYIDADDFEFRCNHVTNWIRVNHNGERTVIYDVCAIKTVKEEND